jgi:GT2 family glycosyltransferase
MVRNKVFQEAGGLDENIFMYWEDAEWCYRIKQAGWSVYYLPLVKIAHYRGQSSRLRNKSRSTALSVWATRQYAAGLVYFYNKHFGKGRAYLLRLIIILTSVLKALLWTLGSLARPSEPERGQRARSYLAMIPVALGLGGSPKG